MFILSEWNVQHTARSETVVAAAVWSASTAEATATKQLHTTNTTAANEGSASCDASPYSCCYCCYYCCYWLSESAAAAVSSERSDITATS